ncbi:MAG: helix-turn-helix domain-containing protein [Bacteroidota bacterium]
MAFTYFPASPLLKPYVKCYYTFVSDTDISFADTVFPSGDMEMIFNLGSGSWEFLSGGQFYKTPAIELWGQVTKPLAIKSKGQHIMLGVKFLSHTAAIFFDEEIGALNNCISDAGDIVGRSANQLHARLLEIPHNAERIALVENFLLQRLLRNQKKSFSIDKVGNILSSIRMNAEENNIYRVASSHGMTTRHMHKLVYRYTGLSPKSFNKINRFQQSLRLIAENKYPLTSIAYDCGYFDQSHFIRDFKAFTGLTPSAYLENKNLFLQ